MGFAARRGTGGARGGAGTAPVPLPPAGPAPAEADDEGVSEQVSTDIFARYQCRSLDRGNVHPGDIAEPSSLSAISLPVSKYPLWDSFVGTGIVESGKLSQLQLEGVHYACQKHLEILPTGQRAGFFIGDGAGVGKGRQIAGIVLDNFVRGRLKHVWVSTSTDLHADAIRDLRDLGMQVKVVNNCQELDTANKAGGMSKDYQEAVLFLTYATLVSSGRGRPRLDQILEWLGGPKFDGCLVFDECHKAKNFVPGGKEGSKASSKVSAAVIELQRRLPMARVVYCSATGVSEVAHMAYLERMGLWGAGSAFPEFEAFLNSMKHRGVSFLEMLAMEMKSEGKYVARGLSFKDAEFMHVQCTLEPAQVELYNAASALWQQVRAELANALAMTGHSNEVWRTFWAAQQRFFKLLCVSMKVPTVVRLAREALAAGQAVVIGLQSTGESAADFLGMQPGQACGFVSACREIVRRFLKQQFPVMKNPKVPADGLPGQETAPATDASGKEGSASDAAVVVPECVATRKALLRAVERVALPTHFLDALIDELGGPDSVAEMTGRSARVARVRGQLAYVARAKTDTSDMDSLNMKEKDAFMRGTKLVAIISDAASTGISLHAVAGAKNTRRRVHITIELPWSADKAIQQLGRSHRSNQVSGPIYKLVTTDVGGEQRFAAAVARRLQSLGALTRGDRRAASGVDLSESNIDTPLGRTSLRKMYDAILLQMETLAAGVDVQDVVAGVDMEAAGVPELKALGGSAAAGAEGGDNVAETARAGGLVKTLHAALRNAVDIMGVGGNTPAGDTVAEDELSTKSSKELGDVRRFLNRLLGLPIHRQNLLFNYFAAVVQRDIRTAKAEGHFIEGMSDLPSSNLSVKGKPKVLWVDPHSSLKTMQHTLLVDRGVSFDAALERLHMECPSLAAAPAAEATDDAACASEASGKTPSALPRTHQSASPTHADSRANAAGERDAAPCVVANEADGEGVAPAPLPGVGALARATDAGEAVSDPVAAAAAAMTAAEPSASQDGLGGSTKGGDVVASGPPPSADAGPPAAAAADSAGAPQPGAQAVLASSVADTDATHADSRGSDRGCAEEDDVGGGKGLEGSPGDAEQEGDEAPGSGASSEAEDEPPEGRASRSGFYISRSRIMGRMLVILAIERPGQGMFSICRPNTGQAFMDMDRGELAGKYRAVSAEAARPFWESIHSATLDNCLHGAGCPVRGACRFGRRVMEVTVLSGSVVRVWGVLEQVLKKHSFSLSKMDRAMRIVRVDMAENETLVGVRYKAELLSEVVALLQSLQAQTTPTPAPSSAAAGSAPARSVMSVYADTLRRQAAALGLSGGDTQARVEAVTPINARAQARLFRPPRNLLTFFQRHSGGKGGAADKADVQAAPSMAAQPPGWQAAGTGAPAAPVGAPRGSQPGAQAPALGGSVAPRAGASGKRPLDDDVPIIDLTNSGPTRQLDARRTAATCRLPGGRPGGQPCPGAPTHLNAPDALPQRAVPRQSGKASECSETHPLKRLCTGSGSQLASQTSSEVRVEAAGTGVCGNGDVGRSPADFESIISMGFKHDEAQVALKVARGNVAGAIDYLLTRRGTGQPVHATQSGR